MLLSFFMALPFDFDRHFNRRCAPPAMRRASRSGTSPLRRVVRPAVTEWEVPLLKIDVLICLVAEMRDVAEQPF